MCNADRWPMAPGDGAPSVDGARSGSWRGSVACDPLFDFGGGVILQRLRALSRGASCGLQAVLPCHD